MNSLRNITESDIISCIDAAESRVVFLAPGISSPVADALSRAWRRLNPDDVSVIIDTDPEVCRMGYGTIEALKIAQTAASERGHFVP